MLFFVAFRFSLELDFFETNSATKNILIKLPFVNQSFKIRITINHTKPATNKNIQNPFLPSVAIRATKDIKVIKTANSFCKLNLLVVVVDFFLDIVQVLIL